MIAFLTRTGSQISRQLPLHAKNMHSRHEHVPSVANNLKCCRSGEPQVVLTVDQSKELVR